MNDIKVWIDGHNVEVTGVIPISDYVIATPQTGKLCRSEVKSYWHTRYSKVLLEGKTPKDNPEIERFNETLEYECLYNFYLSLDPLDPEELNSRLTE